MRGNWPVCCNFFRPSDVSATAVANNNLISLKGSGSSDLFDVAKKLKAALVSKAAGKLNSVQQRGINLNHTLLLLYQKKYDECKEAIATMSAQMPNSDVPPLISAAILHREKKVDEAIRTMQEYINRFSNAPEKTVRVQLSLAQLYMNQSNPQEAIAVLKDTPVRCEPALVAAQVSILQKTAQVSECIKVFDDSIAHWQKSSSEAAKSKLIILLNKSAQYKFANNRFAEAAQGFEQLVRLDPNNKDHLASLVNALSHFDIAKAEQFSSQLPLIDVRDIDAAALDSVTVNTFKAKKHTLVPLASVDEDSGAQDKEKKKKKKQVKRRNKPAKKMDPNKKPDPERWVAKKLRTNFKKKQQTGMRSQGSTNTEAQQKLQHQQGAKAAATPTPSSPSKPSSSSVKPPSSGKQKKVNRIRK